MAQTKKAQSLAQISLPIIRPDLLPPGKMHRDEITPDDSPCNHCVGKCCRYFTVPLKTPRTRADFDELRWFLAHRQTVLFTETETTRLGKKRTRWNLVVWTECQYLQADHRCGIYETRPQVCRDYKSEDCEYDTPWVFEQSFETPEAIASFADRHFAEKQATRRRG